MKNNFDPKLIDAALKASGGKIDKESLNQAVKSGDSSALLNNLGEADRQKLNGILSDKKALENILKSPLAQELIKKLSGGA